MLCVVWVLVDDGIEVFDCCGYLCCYLWWWIVMCVVDWLVVCDVYVGDSCICKSDIGCNWFLLVVEFVICVVFRLFFCCECWDCDVFFGNLLYLVMICCCVWVCVIGSCWVVWLYWFWFCWLVYCWVWYLFCIFVWCLVVKGFWLCCWWWCWGVLCLCLYIL